MIRLQTVKLEKVYEGFEREVESWAASVRGRMNGNANEQALKSLVAAAKASLRLGNEPEANKVINSEIRAALERLAAIPGDIVCTAYAFAAAAQSRYGNTSDQFRGATRDIVKASHAQQHIVDNIIVFSKRVQWLAFTKEHNK